MARKVFRRRRLRVQRRQLKFLDETGVTMSLTPLYGRPAPGVRVVDRVPRNYDQPLSLGGETCQNLLQFPPCLVPLLRKGILFLGRLRLARGKPPRQDGFQRLWFYR